MAPPKRKTSGRVTPKGTRPGQSPVAPESQAPGIASSSRYTPPSARDMDESPKWVPILMVVLLGIAVAMILLRYLVWSDSNLPVVIGLGFLLAGLFVATKWQ